MRNDGVASDGDFFQKRVSWGWGKALQALRKGTPARELDALIDALITNALRNTQCADARAPALGSMVKASQAA
jgi:hypothetical protein